MKLSHMSAFEEWYENNADAFDPEHCDREAKKMAQRAYCDGRRAGEFNIVCEQQRAGDAERKYERLLTAVYFSVLEFRAAQQSHADGDSVEASVRFEHAMQRLIDELGCDPSTLGE